MNIFFKDSSILQLLLCHHRPRRKTAIPHATIQIIIVTFTSRKQIKIQGFITLLALDALTA